jgi:acetyl-CoA C-acetyltransferase
MSEDRTPVLVGAAQLTVHEAEPLSRLEPMAMMAETARAAARDAGAGERLLQKIDCLQVVDVMSWKYGNPARVLAERLGIHPRREMTTTAGGTSPQLLLNLAARLIAAGEAGVALMGGAESINARRRAKKSGRQVRWPRSESTPEVVGDGRDGATEMEKSYGLFMPVTIYPLFENALRRRHGIDLSEQRRRLGELCHRLTGVAGNNPHAWFPREVAAREIAEATPDNRMISFPYTKRMNAIIDVNQSASVIMTSASAARSLGIPESRWIYLRGSGEATEDPFYVSERPDFHSSPAMARAINAALASAGVTADEVAYLDLYSCFPCAVQMACDMIGLSLDDPRPPTVTGGLPYAGGPGSNYVTHALAAMMEVLRASPGSKGLVTANGWYFTKHAAGVYGAEPPPAPAPAALPEAPPVQPVPVAREAAGRGTIETYTVFHDRQGAPEFGIVVGRLPDGRRFLANTPPGREVLEELMRGEVIGRGGRLIFRDGLHRFDPD